MSEIFIKILLLCLIFSLAFNGVLIFIILYLKVRERNVFNLTVSSFVKYLEQENILSDYDPWSAYMVEHWIRSILLRRKLSLVSKEEAVKAIPHLLKEAILRR